MRLRHILTALQKLFTKAGYRTDRKNVPHSRGLKKADLVIKDVQLAALRNVIIDVTYAPQIPIQKHTNPFSQPLD